MSDPKQMTPAEMRERADEMERDGLARIAGAKRLRETAEEIEKAQEKARAVLDGSGLSRERQSDTIDTMGTAQSAVVVSNAARPGPKFKSRHPLPVKAKARGMSIEDVADELTEKLGRKIGRKFPRTTVRSWYAEKKPDDDRPIGDGRPIPRAVAVYLAQPPWGIPLSAWKNGIDDT